MDEASPVPRAQDAGRRDAGRPGGKRLGVVAVVALVLVVIAGGAVGAALLWHVHAADEVQATSTTLSPAEIAEQKALEAQEAAVTRATAAVGVALPTKPGVPAPALPASGFRHPLAPHQVVAYLPYWYLGEAGTTDLSSLTTVAYYALDIGAGGSLQESGPGWADLGGSGYQQMHAAAHAAGVRVLLTVATDDETVLDAISAAPAASAQRLLAGLVPLLRSDGFDGVDLDLEGRNGADRAGFAQFVRLVAQGVHGADATWDVAIDTYPQSASDPDDFFDIAAIAPDVDQLFVMAYDMYVPGVPSADAPLTGTALSVSTALSSYTAVVPPSKLVLGVPFYGDDWTTGATAAPGSATGPDALPYSTIAASGHAPLWDPTTDTVFINYRYQGKEHQTWFDDPLTLALKTALAAQYHLAGVGMWALGMQGSSADLLQALLGGAPVVKLALAH